MSLVAFIPVLLMSSLAAGDTGTPSHCSVGEQVIFSCKIKGSKKVLSVCASKSLNTLERYVQYRYGSLNSVELEFPPRRAQSIEQFKAAHYFRAHVDRREVTFANQDVRYTLFSYYEGEERPPQREAGVTIHKGGGDSDGKTFQCAAPYVNHLQELDEVVSCDRNSPLSEGSCPK